MKTALYFIIAIIGIIIGIVLTPIVIGIDIAKEYSTKISEHLKQ